MGDNYEVTCVAQTKSQLLVVSLKITVLISVTVINSNKVRLEIRREETIPKSKKNHSTILST